MAGFPGMTGLGAGPSVSASRGMAGARLPPSAPWLVRAGNPLAPPPVHLTSPTPWGTELSTDSSDVGASRAPPAAAWARACLLLLLLLLLSLFLLLRRPADPTAGCRAGRQPQAWSCVQGRLGRSTRDWALAHEGCWTAGSPRRLGPSRGSACRAWPEPTRQPPTSSWAARCADAAGVVTLHAASSCRAVQAPPCLSTMQAKVVGAKAAAAWDVRAGL